MAFDRLRGLTVGRGRWVRAPRMAVLTLVLAVAAVAAGEVLLFRWAMGSADPARTLAAAATLLHRPVHLESALAVSWSEALSGARQGTDRWSALLVPPVPPALCPGAPEAVVPPAVMPGSNEVGVPTVAPSAADSSRAALADAVRDLDAAIRHGAAGAELAHRMDALRELGPFQPRSHAGFLVRYNLARAYLAAGDAGAAAGVAEPIFTGYLDGDRLPIANQAAAERLVHEQGVSPGIATDGFYARFLAGAIAYRRGDVTMAIAHFRFAINAVNYLVARAPDALAAPGTYARVVVDPGTGGCDTGADGEALTSLDAYSGLVAAYMAAPDFTDPARLPPEVRRTRLEIDADDPFRPVLRHARAIADRPRSSPIPENLLWAASNLQRVYHYNRLNPDARLEVTRAVLLLRLTAKPEWVNAMAANGETDVCAMLGGVGEQLQQEAAARTVSRAPPTAPDSARAAVAIHTFSRLHADCADRVRPPVPAAVRSAWLRAGGFGASGELPALYERWRVALDDGMQAPDASRQVLEARLEPTLRQARMQLRVLGKGRVPADLPATLDAGAGRHFAQAWWRAVFRDVAAELAAAGRGGGNAPRRLASAAMFDVQAAGPGIAARDAPLFLATLDGAIANAGLRPSDVYPAVELAPMARAGGTAAYGRYLLRYGVRSHPAGTLTLLLVVFVLAVVLLVLAHVSWWRYRLLVSDRLYQIEHGRRARGGRA